ncbi:MAG: hypothetical protein NTX47_01385 [Candidatus Omnitrophica bacterium]|nr:hypothetical protein [Candidatus Omnitrophota bacterium]
MKKLIAIIITFIFIFEGTGHCLDNNVDKNSLRNPLVCGNSKPYNGIDRLLKAISMLPEGNYRNEFITRISVLLVLDDIENLISEAEKHQKAYEQEKADMRIRKAQARANNLTTEQLLLITESPDLQKRYIELDARVGNFHLALPYASVVNKPGFWAETRTGL